MKALALVVLLSSSVLAQPKNYVSPPYVRFPLTARADAARLYEATQLELAHDTTALVYLHQSLWFKRDSIELSFTVDSISVRGDKRQALVTRRGYTSGRLDTTVSRWLGYTFRVLDPVYGWIRPRPDSTNTQTTWGVSNSLFTLYVSMDKILGDPTVMGGIGQRPLLRFKYVENRPAWWIAHADSLTAHP
jgi:hypothetical protein